MNTNTTPSVTTPGLPGSSTKPGKPRGSRFQPARVRYRGHHPRLLRKAQNTLWAIRGRDLTNDERGALNYFSSPLVREER